MRMITRTGSSVESLSQAFEWQSVLKNAYRTPKALLDRLNIDSSRVFDSQQARAHQQFSTLVPEPFAAQMEMGNPNDPLLKQVLPIGDELLDVEGFNLDPLQEDHSNVRPGIIHKYQGRILLMAATHCAVNCRYCFRRHFPYQQNRSAKRDWQNTLSYVQNDPSISEVILSGGDPLMLNDAALKRLLDAVEAIAHIKRLRIHTRLPVVIPQRLTPALEYMLASSRLRTVIVFHINHPNELSALHAQPLNSLSHAGISLLNQSVLLKGVNDHHACLHTLSETLFDFGIIPYYLHTLDKVKGASHFDVPEEQAQTIYNQLQISLPGYLVPQLVKEQAHVAHKTRL